MQLLSTLLTLSLSGFIIAAPVVTSEVPGNNRPALTVGDFKNSEDNPFGIAIGSERRPYVEGSIIFPADK
ncbi:hypothetical protein BM221_001493 [Beauveria bassiana]|uniref:Uncharacterized protein n=1 Tax=Beauveria bassiana TaxID=176275 RepID=A0A2N6NVV7_BEABA|nr:hypothetical protein BM221_001493 [Beauveria bassiana]